MALPTELAALTHELKEALPGQAFRFEWSSKAQGVHLLLCGDWNRNSRRSSRTIQGPDGLAITKARQQLSTTIRQHVLMEALKLVDVWNQGGQTNSRRRSCQPLITSALKQQKKAVLYHIDAKQSQDRSKQKHLRHVHSLFDWLESRRRILDSPNSQQWAREGCRLDTDNYSDRLRVAKWACELNRLPWVISGLHKPKAPKVARPFVDQATDADIYRAITMVSDPTAATFFRVVAATGCRPSEVALYDWKKWEGKGRPNVIEGFSQKSQAPLTSIIHPMDWMKEIDWKLVCIDGISHITRDCVSEDESNEITRQYSDLLRKAQEETQAKGFEWKIRWTDLRHLWTLRSDCDGINTRTAAISQSHSEHMHKKVYLRHNSRRQVEAEAARLASTVNKGGSTHA
jgi:integrase